MLGSSNIKRKNSEVFDPEELNTLMRGPEDNEFAGSNNNTSGQNILHDREEDALENPPQKTRRAVQRRNTDGTSGGASATTTMVANLSSSSSSSSLSSSSSSSSSSPSSSSSSSSSPKQYSPPQMQNTENYPNMPSLSLGGGSGKPFSSNSSSMPLHESGSLGTGRALVRVSSLDYGRGGVDECSSQYSERFYADSKRVPPSKFDFVGAQCGSSMFRVLLTLVVGLLLLDRIVLPSPSSFAPDSSNTYPHEANLNVASPGVTLEDLNHMRNILRGELTGEMRAEFQKELHKKLSLVQNVSLAQITTLEKKLKDQETAMTNLRNSIPKLEQFAGMIDSTAKEAVQSRIYDDSNTYFTLLENIINNGSKQRWVFPCTWQDCFSMSQGEFLVTAIEGLSPPARKLDKDQVRILVLGHCSSNLLESASSRFGDRLQKFVVVSSSEQASCAGHAMDEAKALPNSTSAQKAPGFEFIDIDPSSSANTNLDKFPAKFFDAIFINAAPSEILRIIPNLKSLYLPKLRNDGLISGHGYGVQHPTSTEGQTTKVTWLRNDIGEDSKGLILLSQLADVKVGVDILFQDARRKDRVETDPLRVAGDTTWYFYKRKISISDVFGGNRRR